jgi:hypothetical protein
MNDHPMIQSLHAAISRRSWSAVEQAANQIRDDKGIKWPWVERASERHQYVPHPEHPQFCEKCGYAERESLKHTGP